MRVYANRSLPNTSALRISLAELSVDDLRTAYEWSRPQEEALYELERHYGVDGLAWLADFARLDDLPGFRDVELSAAWPSTPCRWCTAGPGGSSTCTASPPIPASRSAGASSTTCSPGKVVLVDVSGLGSTEEVLVASFLTRRVLETWQTAYLDDPDRHDRMPVVSVALEEAQRVLRASKDRESNVFPRVAREGRKFGVGLCAITQQPKLLDDELLSQFNTFFILGLGRREGPQHPALVRQAGHQRPGGRDPDPDAGRVPDRQPGRPVRRARP